MGEQDDGPSVRETADARRTWDDKQYLRFGDERTRAARELLARVPAFDSPDATAPLEIVDLGCGPGNSTALLAARWPLAQVRGVDHAPAMLARARQDCPRATFEEADLTTWEPRQPVDVLFANAVFHWLPDHAALFPRVFSWLRPGGVLAVQMPRNFHEPSHRLMRELPGPWSEAVAAFKFLNPVREPAYYYDLLAPHAAGVDVWQTTYEHVLASAGEIVEWVKGAGLRPYLDAAEPAWRAAYLAAYERALETAYPARVDGRRLFSFPRLFLVAVRR